MAARAQDQGAVDILWRPPVDARERTRIGEYLAWLGRERGLSFDDYESLW
ncbi:MAG: acetoacetyl-CoA synthase, partial [Conexibacter sp.]|nr:acetoacetyl-CoA synthase [Conexibacter sp.]